ncbi:MAG: HEAT repeat domain-containing protein [Pirellulales bacterium]
MMHSTLEDLVRELTTLSSLDESRRAEWHHCALRAHLGTFEVEQLLDSLSSLSQSQPPTAADEAAWIALLESACRALERHEPGRLRPQSVARMGAMYRRLADRGRISRQLLRLLAIDAARDSLVMFAELLADSPPVEAQDVLVAFAPLFQRRSSDYAALFPRLLDGLEHPTVATAVLDLSNFLARAGLVPRHPAAPRVRQLAELLGGLSTRLARVEEHPDQFADSRQALESLVSESVALIVALCDALAGIGEKWVTGKLYQALELSHRRVRTEAAAALARLGDPKGIETLVAMAAEPVVRSRALAYLDELGLLERAPEQCRTSEARAIGDLAAWLAEPTQFGLPPQSIEVFDHCRQHWPGYSAPVDCYLVRYEYRLPAGQLWGIALAGPGTSAVLADLADLPPADIYAVYAGRDTEHAEITETAAADLAERERVSWEQVRSRLEVEGFSDLELIKLGRFFGEEHWIANARHGERRGVMIHDGRQTEWHPHVPGKRPLGSTEFYQLHKGRKLLRAFNP